MAEKEEETPKHIKKVLKIDSKLDVLQARTFRSWGEAHTSAAKKILKDDYSLLNQQEHRDKYISHISKYLVKDAREHFKFEGDEDDKTLEAQLLRAFAGTSRTELRKLVEEHKEGYEQVKDSEAQNAVINVIAPLRPIAYEGLSTKEHLGDVLDYTGLKKGDLSENIHESGLAKVLLDHKKNKGQVRTKLLERLKDDPARYKDNLRAYIQE